MSFIDKIEYSSNARKYTVKHPLLSSITTQVVFWVISFVLLSVIIFLSRHSMIKAFSLPVNLKLYPYAINSAIMGLIYGTGMGMLDYYMDKKLSQKMAMGKAILIKLFLSMILLLLCFFLREYFLFDLIVAPAIGNVAAMNSKVIWDDLLLIILIYSAVMSLVINFMKQVNKKFGPGILLPLLLGRYRHPKEQERIFMFMDLKSSTTIAEELGHFRYSAFIRDAFMDINQELADHNAEVYQYVGDEIVISWKTAEGLRNAACVKFFFACEERFLKREKYYIENYGYVPNFKASLHIGKVITVEIGDIKRDLAHHGDTLNTAARIQSMCNEYKKKLLASEVMIETGKLGEQFNTEYMGKITLKGKTVPVGIISIEK